ncbi:MAG: DNA mismatch repair protein MutL, partial [Chloroflexota bacterium]
MSDDGCGIPGHEVELAFARHATSKLRSVDDLLEVRSLGFRGEALPSIAAMATVTLLTATADATIGTKVVVRDGQLIERSPAARAPGTTVIVRELFQRVPARRMFLRAPQVETAQAELVVRRYALAWPEVAFRLVIDGRDVLHTTGSGQLEDAIAAVYGQAAAARLLY